MSELIRFRAASPHLRTVLTSCLTAVALASCSSSSTGPSNEGVPTVVTLPTTSVGDHDDSRYTITCLVGPESPSMLSSTCPVLRWDGFDYWPLSFGDNRSSMAIHAFNAKGELRTVKELVGARYAWRIDVNALARTVTFHGQTDATVTMTWDELRQMR